MALPFQFCRMPSFKPTSISTGSVQHRSPYCQFLRNTNSTRVCPIWKQDRVVQSGQSSPPRRRPILGSNGDGFRRRKPNRVQDVAQSVWSKTVFAVTLTGVIGTDTLRSCLDYLKTLAAGGDGGGRVNLGPGDGGPGDGASELFQLAVDEDDDEDGEEEEEDEEEEEEEEEELEEDEIEELEDDVDEEDYVDPTAPFECGKVIAIDLPIGPGVPRDVDLFAGLHCQSGFRCSQEELRKDLKTLTHTEGIEHVEVRVTPVKGTKGKKCDVAFVFKSVQLPELKSFQVKGVSAIPEGVINQVMETYNRDFKENPEKSKTSIETIGMMRNIIEKWLVLFLLSMKLRVNFRYQDRGYIMSYIRNFSGLHTGNVTANVVEGRVNQVKVMFVDEEGNEKKKGNATPQNFVKRELSFVVSN